MVKIVDFDFSKPSFKWFTDAKLNITENCLDRHVEAHPEKTAIIFEPNDPNQPAEHISYRELHSRVCKFSNVLKTTIFKKVIKFVFIYQWFLNLLLLS